MGYKIPFSIQDTVLKELTNVKFLCLSILLFKLQDFMNTSKQSNSELPPVAWKLITN